MFENPRRGRQARNFTTNAPKILDLKSSSEQIFSRKLPLGALETGQDFIYLYCSSIGSVYLKIESVHGRTATRCKFLKNLHKATRKSNSKGN